MPLETLPFDVLEHLKSDEDLAFLLQDALESDHAPYIDRAVANLERAKGLTTDGAMSPTERLVRAAEAVGLRLAAVPRAA